MLQEGEMAEEDKRAAKKHNIRMESRNRMYLTGVEDVLSFDTEEILLDTSEGRLLLSGKELHVGRLSLESGEVDVEGRLVSLTYQEPRTGKSFWGKALR